MFGTVFQQKYDVVHDLQERRIGLIGTGIITTSVPEGIMEQLLEEVGVNAGGVFVVVLVCIIMCVIMWQYRKETREQ